MTPPNAPHIPTLDELCDELKDAAEAGRSLEPIFRRIGLYYPAEFDQVARARGFFNPSLDN